VVLNQQALEIALQTVTQQLSDSRLPGLQDIGELAIYLFESLSSTNQTLWELLEEEPHLLPCYRGSTDGWTRTVGTAMAIGAGWAILIVGFNHECGSIQ